MLKRKAASHQEQGSVDDEKQVYNAAGLELPVQTLLNAINVGKGDFHRRMQMIIRSLRLDGRRTHSLLDLSTTPSADQPCVMFQLLRFFCDCCVNDEDAESVKADKMEAQQLIKDKVLPLQQKLLRSFDSATVDAKTGNNALHEMCTLFILGRVTGWSYKFFELLINRGVSVHARNKRGRTPLLQHATVLNDSTVAMQLLQKYGASLNAQDHGGNGLLHHLVKRGALPLLENLCAGNSVSVHTRNKAGRTPLLEFAASVTPQIRSADVMRLLLQYGADLNEQDKKGNGVLHYLIQANAVELLEDFCTGGGVSRLDCFICNSSRQNPFDLIADQMAKQPDDQRANLMRQVLKDAQTALWDQHTRPVLQLHLNQVLGVPDLAELALGFLDGSSRPSDCVAMQTDDDQPAAAAAAARS